MNDSNGNCILCDYYYELNNYECQTMIDNQCFEATAGYSLTISGVINCTSGYRKYDTKTNKNEMYNCNNQILNKGNDEFNISLIILPTVINYILISQLIIVINITKIIILNMETM